jgi:hypothetical protein
MNLYIEVENGQAKNHPAYEDNLINAFGSVPDNWESFVRIEKPTIDVYQIFNSEEPIYQKINNVWTDVWSIRDMTDEEKTSKQQQTKDLWAAQPNISNFDAWIFNEQTCSYQPPTPCPTDRAVFWQGTTNLWVDLPQRPTDGKIYKLDFATATWVEVQQS